MSGAGPAHGARARRPGAWWLALALVLAAALGGVAVVAETVGLSGAAARARWQRLAPAHYQIEVRWRSGGWVAHALLEVRDGRIVAGTDLLANRPMDPVELGMMGHMFPVERMFQELDVLRRWPPTWRGRLAWLLPAPLARQVEPCVAAPPRVRYDPDYGYPAEIRSFTNPCFNGVGSYAAIVRFVPR